jgi:hypothetical protein
MKKLLILTAVTTLLATVGGCRCLDGFCRGSAYPVATGAVCDPCAPTCAPACDPCGGAPGGVMGAPTTTYVPGPVN